MDLSPRHAELSRHAAAEKIERKMDELCGQIGMNVSASMWDPGQMMAHAGLHRLDITLAPLSTKIYFTERELAMYASCENNTDIDMRLRHVVHNLHDEMTWMAREADTSHGVQG